METLQKDAGEELRPKTFRPTGRDLVAIAVTAFVLRALVAVAAMWYFNMTVPTFTFLCDGDSYIRVAIAATGDESTVKPFDWRVFPGYPWLIAAVSAFGVRADVAALLLNWSFAAGAAVLSALLFKDRRIGWAMAVLTPSYVMYSTLVMSEATLMAFIVGGLLLAAAGRPLLGGMLLGYGGLIRPMAAFAAFGYIVWALAERKYRRALVFTLAAVAVVVAGAAVMTVWRGSALEGLRLYASDERAYGGEPLTWPFKSLILTPFRQETAAWKIVFTYAHVALVLAGCAIAAALWRRQSASPQTNVTAATLDPRLNGPWLWANTAFCLCVGAHWGFHGFHRFIVPALPPLFVAYRRWLPDRVGWWLLLAIGSLLMAVRGVAH